MPELLSSIGWALAYIIFITSAVIVVVQILRGRALGEKRRRAIAEHAARKAREARERADDYERNRENR